VAIFGFLLHDLIDRYLFSIWTVIGALIVGALVMLWAERWRRANSGIGFSKGDPSSLSSRKALGIGLAQCLALWPGMSRSMVTIVGGYLAGLNAAKAAEFSFLVGLPTLAGARCLQSGSLRPGHDRGFWVARCPAGSRGRRDFGTAGRQIPRAFHLPSRTGAFLPITVWLWPLHYWCFTCFDPPPRRRHNS
jgi:hypothetical protein